MRVRVRIRSRIRDRVVVRVRVMGYLSLGGGPRGAVDRKEWMHHASWAGGGRAEYNI